VNITIKFLKIENKTNANNYSLRLFNDYHEVDLLYKQKLERTKITEWLLYII